MRVKNGKTAKQLWFGALLLLVTLGVQKESFSQQSPVRGDIAPGRILVKFRGEPDEVREGKTFAKVKGTKERKIEGAGVHVLRLPQGASEEDAARLLASDPDVDFAEVDRRVSPDDITPNDPFFSSQWHLGKIQAPAAWDSTTGIPSIIIAILDTGVDGTHPDLAPRMVPGWNVYDNNSDTRDVYGHGTAVAGTVGAVDNNSLDVSSVVWNTLIMPIRITGTDGMAYLSTITDGLTWAADHGARVANLSFAATDYSSVAAAAQYFQSKGGVVTISAGNAGTYDAASDNPYVLTVSATDSNDNVTSWSNTGKNVDLSSPGDYILTLNNGGGYGYWSGTSFSAPIVAGVAALVLSANPNLSGPAAQNILKNSADDLGPAGWDPGYGAGRVNANRAVALALAAKTPTSPTPPVVSFSSPKNGATLSGTTTLAVLATDSSGIRSVTLIVDGSATATDTTYPYSFGLNTTTLTNSTHSLSALATDMDGLSAEASVTVTIANAVADTEPPTVSITSPQTGAIFSGNMAVTVAAADNSAIASVTLNVDGVRVSSKNSAPYTFNLNTSNWTNTSHTLTAVAVDKAGNTNNVSVSVIPDSEAPTATISAPANGSRVSGNIAVAVTAVDNIGVAKIELYVDDVRVASANSAKLNWNWNTDHVLPGAHSLKAMAYDKAGNVSTTTITVYK